MPHSGYAYPWGDAFAQMYYKILEVISLLYQSRYLYYDQRHRTHTTIELPVGTPVQCQCGCQLKVTSLPALCLNSYYTVYNHPDPIIISTLENSHNNMVLGPRLAHAVQLTVSGPEGIPLLS